jgi:hypothetical protein
MNINEIGCDGVDVMHLTHDRVHWFVPRNMNFLSS